ncbi:uncharacterized protein LOC117570124 [Drosophila albomicans]|uniref:Uncharacterized protein LOC117570124 n=1 Tax=Drosophila albomicans TaxID=7291 RepID=A0A6P8X6K0_DROAB|nr:uncharacterized protein LOC117570124 [Drosophila albomicans]
MSYEQQPMPPHGQQQMGFNPGYNMYQPMQPANMHPQPYPQYIQPLAMPFPANMPVLMAPQPVPVPHVMVPLPPAAMQNMPHYPLPYNNNNGNHVHATSAAQMNFQLQNETITSPPEQSMPKMKPEPKKPEPMPMPTPKAKRKLLLELTANCVVPKNKPVEGLLYDPDFLDAAQLEANNYLMAGIWYDDYDHMRDTTPPIEGVCFLNPFYSTQPKAPEKPRHHRQHRPNPVPYTKPPAALAKGLPHFPSPSPSHSHSHSQLASLHRLTNANDVNGHGPSMTPRDRTGSEGEQWHTNLLEIDGERMQQEEAKRQQLDQLELDATTAAFEAMQFPGGNNAAAARSRRQRRNRCRGLTQSFGIVAPVLPDISGNRSNNNNMQAVNDVMSLFDAKPVDEKMLPAAAAEVNPNNGLPEEKQGEWPLLFIPNRSEGNMKST